MNNIGAQESDIDTGDGVTVAILAYNEEESLVPTIREMVDALRTAGIPFELNIINDGSQDGTGALADQLASDEPEVSAIHHDKNLGVGPAFRTAIYSGSLPLVTVFAGDGQFPASIVPQFLGRIPDADLVLGFVPDIQESRPLILILFSWLERLIVRILLGRVPRFQGVMMFRREILDGMTLTSEGRGWIIQMEIVLRAYRNRVRIVTEATSLRARQHGASRATTLPNILSNAKQILALWYRLRIRHQ